MNSQFSTAIKIISTLLISCAIGLEIWNIIADRQLPQLPSLLFIISRLAIAVHAAEGIIAAIYTFSNRKQFWQYGIYTFFVGTIGLVELSSQKKDGAQLNRFPLILSVQGWLRK
jgi:undecaprenyl pyrophosphate phosphatase UppP